MTTSAGAGGGLAAIDHVVVLMLENRSFDHMLGYLYADAGNVSPSGQPFEGLTGHESNPDASGNPVGVYQITPSTPNAYFTGPAFVPVRRAGGRPSFSATSAATPTGRRPETSMT